MSVSTIAIDTSWRELRPAVVAWSSACGLVFLVICAGLMSSTPLPVVGWAAAFLFVAVASDVRFRRIPNWLTLPALFAALIASPWAGVTAGPLEAASGAALGLALLLGPYALGGMGAGDVKALMVLGAWLGPSVLLGATAWALIAAGVFGLILLSLRGEICSFALRWFSTLSNTLKYRRLSYEPPTAGSTASDGIPFAVAIAIGLAAQWYGGFPW
jgi:prepilin peptidase CpaA